LAVAARRTGGIRDGLIRSWHLGFDGSVDGNDGKQGPTITSLSDHFD